MSRALRASGQTPPQTPAAASPASTPRQRPPASPRVHAGGKSPLSTPRSAECSTLSSHPTGSLGRANASPPPGSGRPPLSPRVGHPQAKERQPAGVSGRPLKPRKSLIAAAAEIALSGASAINSDDDDLAAPSRDRDWSGTPDFVLRTNPHRPQPLPTTPRNKSYRLSPRVGRHHKDEEARQTASANRGQQTQSQDLIEIPCIPFSTVPDAGSVAASPVSIPRIPLHLLNENDGTCEGGGGSGRGEADPLPPTPGNSGVAGKGRSGSSKRAGKSGAGDWGSVEASRVPPESPRRSNVQQSALLFALEVNTSRYIQISTYRVDASLRARVRVLIRPPDG